MNHENYKEFIQKQNDLENLSESYLKAERELENGTTDELTEEHSRLLDKIQQKHAECWQIIQGFRQENTDNEDYHLNSLDTKPNELRTQFLQKQKEIQSLMHQQEGAVNDLHGINREQAFAALVNKVKDLSDRIGQKIEELSQFISGEISDNHMTAAQHLANKKFFEYKELQSDLAVKVDEIVAIAQQSKEAEVHMLSINRENYSYTVSEKYKKTKKFGPIKKSPKTAYRNTVKYKDDEYQRDLNAAKQKQEDLSNMLQAKVQEIVTIYTSIKDKSDEVVSSISIANQFSEITEASDRMSAVFAKEARAEEKAEADAKQKQESYIEICVNGKAVSKEKIGARSQESREKEKAEEQEEISKEDAPIKIIQLAKDGCGKDNEKLLEQIKLLDSIDAEFVYSVLQTGNIEVVKILLEKSSSEEELLQEIIVLARSGPDFDALSLINKLNESTHSLSIETNVIEEAVTLSGQEEFILEQNT